MVYLKRGRMGLKLTSKCTGLYSGHTNMLRGLSTGILCLWRLELIYAPTKPVEPQLNLGRNKFAGITCKLSNKPRVRPIFVTLNAVSFVTSCLFFRRSSTGRLRQIYAPPHIDQSCYPFRLSASSGRTKVSVYCSEDFAILDTPTPTRNLKGTGKFIYSSLGAYSSTPNDLAAI